MRIGYEHIHVHMIIGSHDTIRNDPGQCVCECMHLCMCLHVSVHNYSAESEATSAYSIFSVGSCQGVVTHELVISLGFTS